MPKPCNCKPKPPPTRYGMVVWDLHTCPYLSEQDLNDTISNIHSFVLRVFNCGKNKYVAFGDTANKHRAISSLMDSWTTENINPEVDAGQLMYGVMDWLYPDHAPSYCLVISSNRHVLPGLAKLSCRHNCKVFVAHPNAPNDWISKDLFKGVLPDVEATKMFCHYLNSKDLFEGILPDVEATEMFLPEPELPKEPVVCQLRYGMVVWDLHTCPYPSEKDLNDTISNIHSFVSCVLKCRINKYVAFGDTANKHRAISGLMHSWTTENMNPEVDAGQLMYGVMDWLYPDHAPSYCLVISGNRHVLPGLAKLSCRHNCKVFVAHPNAPNDWISKDLFKGVLPDVEATKMFCYEWNSKDLFEGIGQLRYGMVVWDLHTCPYPSEKDLNDTISNIRSVVSRVFNCRKNKYVAFGDTANKHCAISSLMDSWTTANINPEFDARILMGGMMDWPFPDYAPAYFLVISGNKHLLRGVEELRCRRNYNITVAHPNAADTMPNQWNTKSLFSGDLSHVSELKRKAGVVDSPNSQEKKGKTKDETTGILASVM